MLKGAPIELLDYFFNEISVSRNINAPWGDESFEPKDGKISIFRDVQLVNPNDDAYIAIQMKLVVEEKDGEQPPILVSVDMQGLFKIEDRDGLDREKKIILAAVSGASILYGVIREQVVALSYRVVPGGQPFLIPTITFDPEQVDVQGIIEAAEASKSEE